MGCSQRTQRLETCHLLGAQIVDRLVEQEELLLLQRGVQLDLEHPATLDHGAHVGVEQRVAVLAGGLGRVQGQLRVAQEVVGGRVSAEGDADARRQEEVWTEVVELEGLVQSLDHASGERVEPRPAGCCLDQQHELVSAQTTDRVAGPHHVLEPFGDDLQELITGRLPEPLVDILEPVDVDEQRAHQQPRLAPRSREHALRPVQHERAVGKPGEGVVQGLTGSLAGLRRRRQRQHRRAAAAQDEDHQAEQRAQQATDDQQRERATVREHARAGHGGEALHGPSVCEGRSSCSARRAVGCRS